MTDDLPVHWRWFPEARFGLFIHWGPYTSLGRGEQVANREHIDHRAHAAMASAWSPGHCHPRAWADMAVRAGMECTVLTARHHDGYCLRESYLVPTWRLWGWASGSAGRRPTSCWTAWWRWPPAAATCCSTWDLTERAGSRPSSCCPAGPWAAGHPRRVDLRQPALAAHGVHHPGLPDSQRPHPPPGDPHPGRPAPDARPGLVARVRSARLLTTGQPLEVAHEDDGQTLVVRGLPVETPTPQFPVIALECASPPRVAAWAVGPYYGTVEHALEMARRRGPSVWADGQPR